MNRILSLDFISQKHICEALQYMLKPTNLGVFVPRLTLEAVLFLILTPVPRDKKGSP